TLTSAVDLVPTQPVPSTFIPPPVVAMNDRGDAVAAWRAGDPVGVMATRRLAGESAWEPARLVSGAEELSRALAVALGPDGDAAVGWTLAGANRTEAILGIGRGVRASVRPRSSPVWPPAEGLGDDGEATGTGIALGVDGAGGAAALWGAGLNPPGQAV